MKIPGKTKRPLVRSSISGLCARLSFAMIMVTCPGLSSTAQAVSPPPDGGYANANTAEGIGALFSLTTGVWNTALGFQALYRDTTGSYNTATGLRALFNNGTANWNTATGMYALYSNSSGYNNTAHGFRALELNTTGFHNTANGAGSLHSNTTGSYNTANGYQALFRNTTGSYNTAVGRDTLYSNTTGSNNIAFGPGSGFNVTTGNHVINIGTGDGADNSTGSINIGSVLFGGGGQDRAFIAGIYGVTTASSTTLPVVISRFPFRDQLGTAVSSGRFKKDIKPMDKASEAILALRPVTFKYKSDNTGTLQFGLIAEEVAKVNPDLVVHDDKGEIYTVRYDVVNAMLLNEFLKDYRKMQELEATVAQEKGRMDLLAASLKEHAMQIQKINAEVGLMKPAPRAVANDQ